MATQACSLLLWLTARRNRYPSPDDDVMYSPTIAPVTLYVAAMRSPLKNEGNAAGKRTLRQICACDAPIARSKATKSGSVAVRPSTVAMVMGKKQNKITTITL